MDKELDKNIVEYYKHMELPKDVLNEIKTSYVEKPKAVNWFSWQKWMAPAAACIAFVFVGTFFVSQWNLEGRLATSVAEEISLNHHKFKDLDFKINEFPLLANEMKKLDFSLARPQRFDSDIKVVGARYCSIQGKIAAQIRLRDDSGRVMTLYQSKGVESLMPLDKNQTTLDGLDVSMWIENGLFNGPG